MKRNECIIFKSKRSYQTPNFNHLTFDATFSKIKPNREVNILRMQIQNSSLVSSFNAHKHQVQSSRRSEKDVEAHVWRTAT